MNNDDCFLFPIHVGTYRCYITCFRSIVELKINGVIDMSELINIIKTKLHRHRVMKYYIIIIHVYAVFMDGKVTQK